MSTGWSLCKTQVFVPLLGRSILVNPGAVGAFRLASTLASATRYGAHVIADAKAGKLTPQGYNCRPISGGVGDVSPTNHSEHAHNIATDVSPWENPMSDAGNWHCAMAMFGVPDGTAFVMAFVQAGFRWGGVWDKAPTLAQQTEAVVAARLGSKQGTHVAGSRIDPMHFELELTPDQAAARDWDAEIEQAEEALDWEVFMATLTDAQKARLTQVSNLSQAQYDRLMFLVSGDQARGFFEGAIKGQAHKPLEEPFVGPFAEKGRALLAGELG